MWSYILGMYVPPDTKLAIFQGSPFHLWIDTGFFFSFPLFIALLSLVCPDLSHYLLYINPPSVAWNHAEQVWSFFPLTTILNIKDSYAFLSLHIHPHPYKSSFFVSCFLKWYATNTHTHTHFPVKRSIIPSDIPSVILLSLVSLL